MHLFAAYRRLGYKPGDFPNAETIGARTLTLPLFTRMADGDVDRVCSALRDILRP
jgi:dTDP-4-amino-4,6-dideoxygalactose transaminase